MPPVPPAPEPVGARPRPHRRRLALAAVLVAAAALPIAASVAAGGPADASGTTSPSSTAAASTYTFDDEFTGAAGVRPTLRWNYQTGGDGWGNGELQQYTDRASNAHLDGAGHLAITAAHETYAGSDGITRNYTSARLYSKTTVGLGYVEARLNLPTGAGLWPAFWMLGSNIYSVGWPTCGEMDVLESINSMSTAYGTIHGARTNQTAYSYGGSVAPPAGLAGSWHTYGISWTASSMTWYVDGKAYYTLQRSHLAANEPWPFDQPQYILLNLAVGGNGPGAPNASTPASAAMLVDWVHAGAGVPGDVT